MKRRQGLTLVELVVVMVLLLFIGLSVGGLVRVVRDTEQSINRTTEMNQTGRIVLQRIASETFKRNAIARNHGRDARDSDVSDGF
jgi:prepilin-type N-terminal cleavage/methylation domain